MGSQFQSDFRFLRTESQKGTLMPVKTKKTKIDSPPPVTTPICNWFSAEAGAQVTYTNAPSGSSINQIPGDVWPFCNANGGSFGPPINFPLVGNTIIYVCPGLAVGDYPYDVEGANCQLEVTKGVTIIDSFHGGKSTKKASKTPPKKQRRKSK
jgi:hypothetical protein